MLKNENYRGAEENLQHALREVETAMCRLVDAHAPVAFQNRVDTVFKKLIRLYCDIDNLS